MHGFHIALDVLDTNYLHFPLVDAPAIVGHSFEVSTLLGKVNLFNHDDVRRFPGRVLELDTNH